MEKNVQTWREVTKNIYTAVLLFSIASVLSVLFGAFGGLWGTGSDLVSFATSGNLSSGPNFFEVVEWICVAGMVVGYVLYIMGLGNLGTLLKEQDSKAIGQVRIGAIILVVASICSIFLPSWIVWIAELVAYIMMFMGFRVLKGSMTLDEKAIRGFSQLYKAMLFILIAVGLNLILGWIPLLGWIINLAAWVLQVIAFVMIIMGWSTIKTSQGEK